MHDPLDPAAMPPDERAREVASILAAGHDLDTGYVERWAQDWEVSDRWDEVLRR